VLSSSCRGRSFLSKFLQDEFTPFLFFCGPGIINHIQKQNTVMRERIRPDERMAVTLGFDNLMTLGVIGFLFKVFFFDVIGCLFKVLL
jgi:hypothetical protein